MQKKEYNEYIYKCKVCGAFTRSPIHCNKKAVKLMSEKQRVKLSKFLSYILRHNPKVINLKLDSQGYSTASVKEIAKRIAKRNSFSWVTAEHIYAVVSLDEKGRFEIRDDKIRAVYGHTLKLKIKYTTLNEGQMPELLYHGTVKARLEKILAEGIKPMKRNFVHLTVNFDDAVEVGKRRKGEVVVLVISPKRIVEEGYNVYKANEKIYLAEYVPPEAILEVKNVR